MADPRIPEAAIRAAIGEIDELEFIDRGSQGDAWRLRRDGGGNEVLKVVIGAEPARVAREIETMQALNHPRVMHFTESGSLTHDGNTWLRARNFLHLARPQWRWLISSSPTESAAGHGRVRGDDDGQPLALAGRCASASKHPHHALTAALLSGSPSATSSFVASRAARVSTRSGQRAAPASSSEVLPWISRPMGP